ncbi:ABC transporter substrate-binding protein [Ktedonospora formicarum]|uniref:ABC transporter substrate-binding protein n=1 Tax=Ktedonospora formicarum TaxID=2778364 RepID=A0A8J3MSX1_9CHLR|nr:ABC transporter substrate-binding protein [Ktedonospora formicarum]GHO46570.1 ABC transporter substrate-binding protein [Ktedonospora formicarum]
MAIFNRQKRKDLDQLVENFATQSMPRREFLQKATAAGLSVSAASALLAACGGAPNTTNGTPAKVSSIDILGQWSGEELDSFKAITSAFTQKTNIKVNIESTRDTNAVLTTRLKGNNPPDMAGMPSIDKFHELAGQNKLIAFDPFIDMNKIKEEYSQTWIDVASFQDHLYGVLPKANTKGTIWYSPKSFKEVGGTIPETWDAMIALSDKIAGQGKYPWSMGIESAASSGWPATDWVAEIYINKYGPEMYDQWTSHKIPWTHASIKDAISMFGKIVTGKHYINGAPQAIVATNFQDASYQPFSSPAKAYMYYLGDFASGFISAQYPKLKAGEDFTFFNFPTIDPKYKGAVTGGVDILAAFKDNDGTRQFAEFMSSAEGQSIWVKRGGATSVNKKVDLNLYPNDVVRLAAQQMLNATSFRIGAGDLLPAALQTAYWKGMVSFVSDPSQLDSILQSLESTAQQAYES